MLGYNPLQLKLSAKLKSQLKPAKNKNRNDKIDLPISSEMIELLQNSMTSSHGYLQENTCSLLSQPLNSMSVFSPTTALLQSSSVSGKIPISALSLDSEQMNNSTGLRSNSDCNTVRPNINEAKSRLEVLWLQRQAMLAKDDGDLTKSILILNEALDVHLGGRSYLDAALSLPVLSSGPLELLDTINSDFFLFDPLAHSTASRIQRVYHRRYIWKGRMSSRISAMYRGYALRKKIHIYREMRRQCAVLVQRRFRIHLKRMHALATKIKQWYKLRKEVKAYNKLLRIYQMARRIQRLLRGNRGRAMARRKRLEQQCCSAIQRNSRAYVCRRDRSFAIILFHRVFFKAVRLIQMRVRAMQAVKRSQIRLLMELAHESVRSQKERISVLETLRMHKIRNRFYNKSDAGKTHIEAVKLYLRAADKTMGVALPFLSEEQRDTARVTALLESFDEEGVGAVSVSKLGAILDRLCIPVSSEALLWKVARQLDAEDSGVFSVDAFLEWFRSETADDLLEPDGILDKLRQLKLSLRFKLNGFNGRMTAKKRAEKYLYNQQAVWMTKNTIATFRRAHAPKYQCCQCLQAFVLFTDYHMHFERDSGKCLVTGEKGLFYPRYWVQAEWRKQRECEYEVQRASNEHAFAMNAVSIGAHADSTYRTGVERTAAQRLHACQASESFFSRLCDIPENELGAQTVREVMDMIESCCCASVASRQSNLSDRQETSTAVRRDVIPLPVLQVLFRYLQLPIRWKWILADGCYSLEELQRWLLQCLTPSALTNQSELSDHASFTDNSNNAKLQDLFGDNIGALGGSNFAKPVEMLHKVGGCTVTYGGKLKMRCWQLGNVYVEVLRLSEVVSRTVLCSLIEFRSLSPRRTSVSDAELWQLGLPSLTVFTYREQPTNLLFRLQEIRVRLSRLYSVVVPRRYFLGHSLRRLLRYAPVEPSSDTSEVPLSELLRLRLNESHAQTQVQLRSRVRSRLGRLVVQQLGHSLARRRDVLVCGTSQSRKVEQASDAVLQYVFSLVEIPSSGPAKGVDICDLDLLLRRIGCQVSSAGADWEALSKHLDPSGLGLVSSQSWLQWAGTGNQLKPFSSWPNTFRTELEHCLDALTVTDPFSRDAKLVLNVRMRHINRRLLILVDKLLREEKMQHQKQYIPLGNQNVDAVEVVDDDRRLLDLLLANSGLENCEVHQRSRRHSLGTTFEGNDNTTGSEERGSERGALEEWSAVQELRGLDEQGEHHVLFRLVERKTESALLRALVVSTGGRHQLFNERLMVRSIHTMLDALNIVVQNRVESATFIAEIICNFFDLDCSGFLDEQETRCLLLCCAGRQLDEKQFAFHFPEFSDSINVSISTERLADYLVSTDSGAHPVSAMRNDWICAFHILLCLHKQTAHREVEETVVFSKYGSLMTTRDVHRQLSKPDRRSLMLRSQVLAMRQVTLFLDTTHGQFKLDHLMRTVEFLWDMTLSCADDLDSHRDAALSFAVLLHCDREERMLVTDLPHLVKYVADRLRLAFTDTAQEMYSLIQKLRCASDLYWLGRSEVGQLLSSWFEHAPVRLTKETNRDAKCKMMSCARQQAVLVSMQFQDVDVPDTNYRCAILGLQSVVRRLGGSGRRSGGVSITHLLKNRDTLVKERDGASLVPRESTVLHLLSQGYTFNDMYLPKLGALVGLDHSSGALHCDMVSLKELDSIAHQEVSANRSWWQSVTQCCERVRVTRRWRLHVEFKKVTAAIKEHSQVVDNKGGEYLKEIITGRSKVC